MKASRLLRFLPRSVTGRKKSLPGAGVWGVGVLAMVLSQLAAASQVSVSGKVLWMQGHQSPACREVAVQDSAGTTYVFRLQNLSPDTIGAVFMAATVSGAQVDVIYDTSITTGCGTEPAVQYVTLRSVAP